MRRLPILLAAAGLLLAGCSSNSTNSTSTAVDPASLDDTGFPMTIENCGHQLTIKSPATRIFSFNQEMSESLLSMGLANQMVATGRWNEPVLPSLAADAKKVKNLGNDTSAEAVLDLEPDLLAASWDPFQESSFGSRATFEKVGVPVYISPTECVGKQNTGDSDNSERTGMIDVNVFYDELKQLATIAGRPDRGTELVDDLKKKVDDAQKYDFSSVTAAFWYADSETPYMAGCCGASGFIAEQLKLKNVFADTKKDWPQVSWEAVAAKNPDVLVIPDLDRDNLKSADSGAAKIAFLESNPITKQMDAVKNKRYVLIRGTVLTPSVEMIYGISDIAKRLTELGFK
ncbi:MAG: ABC transporter substrate-binding protein [Gordonia sp. (in: high G+C Gram-positive bacteria)]